jgi:uncharacterized protein YceK
MAYHPHAPSPRLYAATCLDLDCMKEKATGTRGKVGQAFWMSRLSVDLPICLAVDTILLPVGVLALALRGDEASAPATYCPF